MLTESCWSARFRQALNSFLLEDLNMSRRPWILYWGVSFVTLLVFDAPLGFAQRVTFDQQRARESSPKEQPGGRAPWLMNRGLGQLLPQPSLRGIEKKDIRRGTVSARPPVRLVFLYDDAEVPDPLAAALARVTTPNVVAKIAPQLLHPPAPQAARSSSRPAQGAHPNLIFVAARKNADCDQPGCVKSEYGCFCYRLLDIEKHVLSEYPLDDPEFTPTPIKPRGSPTGSPEGSGGSGGRLASPGSSGRTVVIVLGESLQAKLADPKWWERNRGWFEKEVTSKIIDSPTQTNLTIKTKSTPP